MSNTFDFEYEQKRLDMLIDQCLAGTDISGEIMFGALEQENRCDFVHWGISGFGEEKIDYSGFKHYLHHLLDDLMIYRTNNNQEFSGCGVVTFLHTKASIKWLSDSEMECRSGLKRIYNSFI